MPKLKLMAPLAGWSTPLGEVPDEAFSQQMLGDGVAIDPTGSTLYAPCDGDIVAIPASNHAVTIRSATGADILMHVGVDTVKLNGHGFSMRVRAGASVQAGQPLLDFDLDELARGAPSLITPIVIMDGQGYRVTLRNVDRSVRVGDVLMEIDGAQLGQKRDVSVTAEALSRRLVIALEHGIHARPAAMLANSIKGLAAEVSMNAHGRTANLTSAVALMSLGVRRGDEIVLSASGAEAARALTAVEAALHAVPVPRASRAPQSAPAMNPPTVRPSREGVIRGVVASRGLAVGQAVHLTRPEPRVAESGRGVTEEQADLSRARAAVKVRIQALAAAASDTMQEVLEAHVAFLDDRTLVDRARAWIVQGKSAGFAWRQSVNETVADLRGAGDERIRERVDDLNDLAAQVLLSLAGKTATVTLPERAIVLADELLPSQFVALPRERIAGICVGGGGATSHVAILAAATEIPMIVAAGPAIIAVAEGSTVVLDAEAGLLLTAPSDTEIRTTEHAVAENRARHAAALKDARLEGRTADGVRIEMFANVGSAAEARKAIEQGAEGCGLLRSEFLFLERATPPEEAYQTVQYQTIAEIFSGFPLVVRTLDAGGDKPIAYLPLPAEENPALGLRGVRTSLWRPDLLRTQLRAILSVRPAGQCRVLLPMVTSSDEIRSVRALLDEEQAALGLPIGCPLGIMIETPAAALSAGSLAAHADFLSIGTNDLTQYTLAMDRGHAQLAERLDALHPAVLRLIAATVAGARKHNRKVSVCGGLASDPAAAGILIGLGVDGLSVVPAVIAQLKTLIRTLRTEECRALAARALEQDSAAGVRSLTVTVPKAVP